MSGQLLTDIRSLGNLLASGSSVTAASSTLVSTYSGDSLSAILSAQFIDSDMINNGAPPSSASLVASATSLALGLTLGLGIVYIGGVILAGLWYWKKYNVVSSKVEAVTTPRSVAPKNTRVSNESDQSEV